MVIWDLTAITNQLERNQMTSYLGHFLILYSGHQRKPLGLSEASSSYIHIHIHKYRCVQGWFGGKVLGEQEQLSLGRYLWPVYSQP